MVTRGDYVDALRRERAFIASDTLTEDVKAQRLADIDTELARFDDAPKRAPGRRPETA